MKVKSNVNLNASYKFHHQFHTIYNVKVKMVKLSNYQLTRKHNKTSVCTFLCIRTHQPKNWSAKGQNHLSC